MANQGFMPEPKLSGRLHWLLSAACGMLIRLASGSKGLGCQPLLLRQHHGRRRPAHGRDQRPCDAKRRDDQDTNE